MENKNKKKILFVITKSNWGETRDNTGVARTEADAPSQGRKIFQQKNTFDRPRHPFSP
jgi:hypothetical protein